MPGVHEMPETLCVENVGELRKMMLELAFGPQNDSSNLEEPIGAMTQKTCINYFEFLLAEQIRSSLLLGRDWLIGNRDFGSVGHGLEGIGYFFTRFAIRQESSGRGCSDSCLEAEPQEVHLASTLATRPRQ